MRGAVLRFFESDLWWSFSRSPATVTAAAIGLILIFAALFAPWLAPYDPFDLAALDLAAAFLPPLWSEGGRPAYLLGTDAQGRDLLSAILYGARISLAVGLLATLFAVFLGVLVGLIAGYGGTTLDSVLMRLCDIQLTFPSILIALLIDGMARAALPRHVHEEVALMVVIFAIGISEWPKFARTVRGSTLVERNKEYVQAAQVIGIHPLRIMLRHVLPNVLGPVLVLATLNLGLAILAEATLSFLGVGVPPTTPSLGTLIRIGNDYLFSGEWWITLFPAIALVALVLSVNTVGDWLRDALKPKLR